MIRTEMCSCDDVKTPLLTWDCLIPSVKSPHVHIPNSN